MVGAAGETNVYVSATMVTFNYLKPANCLTNELDLISSGRKVRIKSNLHDHIGIIAIQLNVLHVSAFDRDDVVHKDNYSTALK